MGSVLTDCSAKAGKIIYPAYDGNGNIVRLFESVVLGTLGPLSTQTVASYAYDGFGNRLNPGASDIDGSGYAEEQEFGFSTKFRDAETGLIYYGYRYYDPVTGRWPSRDPIEEDGGLNLFGFVGNDGVTWVDILGFARFGLPGYNHYTLEVKWRDKEYHLDIAFKGCDKSQEEDLFDAYRKAFRAIRSARSDLEAGNKKASTLVDKWFGGTSGSVNGKQRGKIEDVIEDVDRNIRKDTICITCTDCDCYDDVKGANAYTSSGGIIDEIFVCKERFFGYSLERMAAIILHELTHEISGTEDHGYVDGAGGYVKKGKSVSLDSEQLINNADTYEEFLLDGYIR